MLNSSEIHEYIQKLKYINKIDAQLNVVLCCSQSCPPTLTILIYHINKYGCLRFIITEKRIP